MLDDKLHIFRPTNRLRCNSEQGVNRPWFHKLPIDCSLIDLDQSDCVGEALDTCMPKWTRHQSSAARRLGKIVNVPTRTTVANLRICMPLFDHIWLSLQPYPSIYHACHPVKVKSSLIWSHTSAEVVVRGKNEDLHCISDSAKLPKQAVWLPHEPAHPSQSLAIVQLKPSFLWSPRRMSCHACL